jgi:hypothetical protein
LFIGRLEAPIHGQRRIKSGEELDFEDEALDGLGSQRETESLRFLRFFERAILDFDRSVHMGF